MVGATNIAKSIDKEEWVFSGFGIVLDGTGSWNFGNDYARNVLIVGVDNSFSFHTENLKHYFLVSGKGPSCGINENFVSPDKKFSHTFSNKNSKFCRSLHYNCDNSYLFAKGKEIFKSKAKNKSVNFSTQFCLGSISNGLDATEFRELSLKGNLHDSIDKSSILITSKLINQVSFCIIEL